MEHEPAAPMCDMPVALFADDYVMGEVIAVVLTRAGYAPCADEATITVHARADRIDVVGTERVSLPMPVSESELLGAVRRLAR
jgi:hypothetical protein